MTTRTQKAVIAYVRERREALAAEVNRLLVQMRELDEEMLRLEQEGQAKAAKAARRRKPKVEAVERIIEPPAGTRAVREP